MDRLLIYKVSSVINGTPFHIFASFASLIFHHIQHTSIWFQLERGFNCPLLEINSLTKANGSLQKARRLPSFLPWYPANSSKMHAQPAHHQNVNRCTSHPSL